MRPMTETSRSIVSDMIVREVDLRANARRIHAHCFETVVMWLCVNGGIIAELVSTETLPVGSPVLTTRRKTCPRS